ncbi:MAG: hypothetical protein U9R40_05485 [Synergistota bacterium]|nr:hypothetical protein [Synergistota bacterium]
MQSGKPENTDNFRLVEDDGFRLWVSKELSFRGENIRLDWSFTQDGPIVYADNAVP